MGAESIAMKLLFLAMMLFFITASAQGQNVYARISGEATAPGLRCGGAVGYITKRKFQLGVFYQQSVSASEFIGTKTTRFIGGEALVPLAKGEKLYLSAHLRAGVADKQFLAIVPGLRTSIQVAEAVEIAMTMHWRYNRPAHELSIQFKI
jgi:hypothetical protein